MFESFKNLFPFNSSATAKANVSTQPLLVVEMSETAIRYISVGPNVEDGVPHSLHASGCLLVENYPTVSAWHNDAIGQLRKYKIENSKVIGLLSANDYLLYQTQMVLADSHDEIVFSMRERLKELIGGEPTDYCVDVVSMADTGGRSTQQVVLVAAKNDVIAARLAQFETIGLTLDALSIYETSLSHLVSGLLPESSGLASLYVTDDAVIISACQHNRLVMFRRLPKEIAIADSTIVPAHIITEVVRSLDYLGRQFPDLKLDALFVDAGLETQVYLDTVKSEVSIPCEPLTPYASLSEEVAPLFIEQRLTVLAGAALSYTEADANINLLSVGVEEKTSKSPANKAMLIFCVALILFLGAVGYRYWLDFQDSQAHAAAWVKHKAELSVIEKSIQTQMVEVERREKLQHTLTSYLVIQGYLTAQGPGSTWFSSWLEILARSTSDGLWLTNIEFTSSLFREMSFSGMVKSGERLDAWVFQLNAALPTGSLRVFEVVEIKTKNDTGYLPFVVKLKEAKQ